MPVLVFLIPVNTLILPCFILAANYGGVMKNKHYKIKTLDINNSYFIDDNRLTDWDGFSVPDFD